jgi:hypothetical protein
MPLSQCCKALELAHLVSTIHLYQESIMPVRNIASSILAAFTVSGSAIGITALSAITPLTQSAQAAYIKNCGFTAEIYQQTNIRPEPNTYKSTGKVLYPAPKIEFSTFEEGQPIWDPNANNRKGAWDPLWFKLSDGRGYVASAVVYGYPPTDPKACKAVSNTTLPTTVEAANPFFKLQFSHPKYNPGGPLSSGNCGPASLAMALAALNLESPGLTIQQSIDRASERMVRRSSALSEWDELQRGISKSGRTPEDTISWESLDSALAAQKPVILNGWLGANWRNQFPARVGSGDISHLNVVLGKTSDGKYLVADPMHTGGVVAMTRKQLTVFFSLKGQGGNPWGIALGK